MVTRFLLFLLLFLSWFTTKAQRDFREGFIITQENDSISGKVLYKDTNRKFEECVFIKSGDTEPVTYYASQLQGYSISGRTYLSKEIPSDQNIRKVYAMVLVSGKARLLFAYDKYFLEKDGVMKELVERKTTIDNLYVRTDKEYRGVLASTLTDCPSVAAQISKTQMSGPSLTKVVEKYNNCFPDPSQSQSKSTEKGRWFQLAAGLAMGHSSVKLAGFDGTIFQPIADPGQFGRDEYLPGYFIGNEFSPDFRKPRSSY